jgi:molecular chaperone GrpE
MSDIDDEFIPEEDAENPAGAIKKLRDRASRAEAEAKSNLEGWQRAQADLANFRKDEDGRRTHAQDRIKASLAEDLIPVLDSFEMSAKHSDNKDLQVIYKQFLSAIKAMGIEQFGKAGEMFDPRRHEALREVEVEHADDEHAVVSVERSGYSIGDFIIRPAQVSVGSHKK